MANTGVGERGGGPLASMGWLSRVAEYFGVWVTAAVIFGLAFPSLAGRFAPAVLACLWGLFALNFTLADFGLLRAELRARGRMAALMVSVIVLRPLVAYGSALMAAPLLGLDAAWAEVALLYYAVPPAGVTPTLALLFGARFERTLFVTTLATLLAPITIPASLAFPSLLGSVAPPSGAVEVGSLVQTLVLLIFVPLLVAALLRRVGPRQVEALRPLAPGLSTLLLLGILVGAVGNAETGVPGGLQLESLGLPLAWMTGLMAWMALAGALGAGLAADRADRISAALLWAWPNIGLAMVLAAKLFVGGRAALLTVVVGGLLPWALSLGPARAWARKVAAGAATESRGPSEDDAATASDPSG